MGCLDFPLAYFLPATLGACAVCVSVLGSFLCKFVSLKEVTTNRDVFIGVWLRTRLYFVEDNEQEGTWDVLRGCGSYSENVPMDSYWKSAQAFAIMASVIGAITITILIFVSCLPITEKWWKILGFLLICTSLFQGLTLLFLSSNACESGGTIYTDFSTTLEFESQCALASGAKMCISATVLWFVSGALVCLIPCPNDNQADVDEATSDKMVPVVDESNPQLEQQGDGAATGDDTADKP